MISVLCQPSPQLNVTDATALQPESSQHHTQSPAKEQNARRLWCGLHHAEGIRPGIDGLARAGHPGQPPLEIDTAPSCPHGMDPRGTIWRPLTGARRVALSPVNGLAVSTKLPAVVVNLT